MNARSPSDTKGTNLRTRLREATAAAIIDAAEEVFADNGLHAASMTDIAARAGVAVGTLYNHFKDKDTLITDLFQERQQGMLDVIDEQIKAPAADFRGHLTNVLGAIFDRFVQHRRFYSILFERHDESHVYAAASKKPMLPALFERFEKVIKRGLKERAVDPALVDFYPAMLIGMLRATGIHAALHKDAKMPSAEQLAQLFLRGAGA